MARVGHRQLPAGLRGPGEGLRRRHPDGADGRPAHRVPVRAAADGRAALVRHHVRVRGAREGRGPGGRRGAGAVRRADHEAGRRAGRGRVPGAGGAGQGRVGRAAGRAAALRDGRQGQRADRLLSPSEQDHVQKLHER